MEVLKQIAMHSAIYIEEASEKYLAVKAVFEPPALKDWQIQKALEIHKDPYYYKPFVCSVWPVTFFKDISKRTFIDLDIESHVPCIKKKEMKEKTIDRELLNIITIIMGKDIVSLRNFFKQHNVLPSIVSTLVVHFLQRKHSSYHQIGNALQFGLFFLGSQKQALLDKYSLYLRS